MDQPTPASDTLARGREAFDRRTWGDAYALLTDANREAPLGLADLERLAIAAYLVGRDAESAEAWERAHHACLQERDPTRAARCAIRLAFALMTRGEMALAGGWHARARRLLDEGGCECAEQGYLLVPGALHSLSQGDAATAYAMFCQAAELAERFGDPDLTALTLLGRGQAAIGMGRAAEGIELLDEAMIAVVAGEVSPIIAGLAYCGTIATCHEIFDLRRARQWTAALTAWCATQPDLVPYRGQCLVHRAQIMHVHGEWSDAVAEAQRACELLSGQPAAGDAYYELAEILRLRGELSNAETAYREASRLGRNPQPGLALLRLAQGQVETAVAAIRRAEVEAQDYAGRSGVLPAYIEIMLAAGDLESARSAAGELEAIAGGLSSPLLTAVVLQLRGAIQLAEDDARTALATLRQASTAWQELEAPYEAARVRTMIGIACRQLADEDGAQLELDAARRVFRQLGAAPEIARVEALARRPRARPPGGLTTREAEVLRLVAAGKTNRAIASELFLSEKTVARHLSNIFTKLGLSSRAAATAYAYEHQLV